MADNFNFVVKKVSLETVCGITSKIPANEHPEFAFAGKSNVGKSSLINALINRKAFARTSAQPGKTQTINFYNINDDFYLVDLPGYGYTRIAEYVKADWGKMVERYLKKSSMLIKVFLLVDMRHKPTEDDRLMYDWIVSQGFAPVIIATKSDKLKKNEKPKALKLIRDTFGLPDDGVIIPFSAIDKNGLNDIYAVINSEKTDAEHKE
ncbi:MAG: ribosome biogenesis GTP-binding protein YihA/YsxC [Lachnospiraceae bacterium]|nr:ribosome biogenesis GTP-binding protein YihA/YsxC [Lachnospiraceae bacterium]